MFRKKVKKAKSVTAIQTTSLDNVVEKKKKKTMSHTSISLISFGSEAADMTPVKKKRKKGMGFGAISGDLVDGMVVEEEEAPPSVYDLTAMKRLKATQNYTVSAPKPTSLLIPTPAEKEKEKENEKRNEKLKQQQQNPNPNPNPPQNEFDTNDSFISLDGGSNNALHPPPPPSETSLQSRMNFESNFHGAVSSAINNNDDDEDTQVWENEVVKRGVSAGADTRANVAGATATATAPPPAAPAVSPDSLTLTGTASIASVRAKLTSAHGQLSSLIDTTISSLYRRETELLTANSELQEQLSILDETAPKYEWFQQAREKLGNFIGALREWNGKILLVEGALVGLERDVATDVSSGRKEEEDDCEAWLREAGLLGNVVGRASPHCAQTAEENLVDEFGRDLSYQSKLDAEQRRRQRVEARKSITKRSSKTTTLYIDNENRISRRKNFAAAVDAAGEDIDEQFLSLRKLTDVFEEWRGKFAESYEACYGDLLYGGLVEVHARGEFVKYWDSYEEEEIKNENEHGHPVDVVQNMEWFRVVEEYNLGGGGGVPKRIVEKAMVGTFAVILEECYDLRCTEMTNKMLKFAEGLLKVDAEFEGVLLAAITNNLRVAVTGVKACNGNGNGNGNADAELLRQCLVNNGHELVSNSTRWKKLFRGSVAEIDKLLASAVLNVF